MDLFSEDSEKARLKTPVELPTSKLSIPEESYVFNGIESPNQSRVDVPATLTLRQSQDAPKTSRYEVQPEDELVQFNITQDITQTMEITKNVIVEANNQDTPQNDSLSMLYDGLEDATVPIIAEECKIEAKRGYLSSGDEQFVQNRTSALPRRNTFMSSDDEQKKNNITGNSEARKRKSVKEVQFKRSQKESTPTGE